jgi:hypothetical protein
MDSKGYHRLNTNEFDNSIDNMLYDYQGNLWFTSSRLGLLRMVKSPFKDVYRSIGIERQVVNAIVFWQGAYYIGTDKGLDVVDKACKSQIDNSFTEELAGKRIRCMYVDDNDHLWVCTYGNGLLEYAPDGGSWTYNVENGSFGNRARIVTGLSDGRFMVASAQSDGNLDWNFWTDSTNSEDGRYDLIFDLSSSDHDVRIGHDVVSPVVPCLTISFDSSESAALLVLLLERRKQLGNDLPSLGPLDAVFGESSVDVLAHLIPRHSVRNAC